MDIPENLLYTKDHEWIKYDNDIVIIGITDFAQGELGDIIFVELPEIKSQFNKGDSIGTLEAVKTVADIYSPLKGEIVEINLNLEDEPELINKDPYKKGWIVKISNFKKNDSDLLTAKEYKEFLK